MQHSYHHATDRTYPSLQHVSTQPVYNSILHYIFILPLILTILIILHIGLPLTDTMYICLPFTDKIMQHAAYVFIIVSCRWLHFGAETWWGVGIWRQYGTRTIRKWRLKFYRSRNDKSRTATPHTLRVHRTLEPFKNRFTFKLYSAHRTYLSQDSHSKVRLFPCTEFCNWFMQWRSRSLLCSTN